MGMDIYRHIKASFDSFAPAADVDDGKRPADNLQETCLSSDGILYGCSVFTPLGGVQERQQRCRDCSFLSVSDE